MTTTNLTSLAYVPEIVAGTIPTSPAWQELPPLSIGLIEEITGVASEAITGNRMKDDIIIVDADVMGDNNFELSFVPWKPLMVALMQQGGTADADVDISTSNLAAVLSSGTFTTTTENFVTEGIVVGQWVKVAGMTNALNNGIFRISAVAATILTIDSTIHTDGLADEAEGQAATIKSEMYRNSNSVPDTFAFRKKIVAGGTPYYFYYNGGIINSMSFALTTASIISGAINIVARTGEGTTTPKSGETTVAVPAYNLLNATSSVGATYITGLATAIFSSININVNNNMTPKKGIGTLGAIDNEPFDFEVISDIEMYFDDLSLYTAFKASTGFLVAFTLTDAAGNSIVMSMPNCKFLNLSEPIPGKNAFVMETGQMESLRDASLNCNFQFDFIAA
jgi:hypothetical protein